MRRLDDASVIQQVLDGDVEAFRGVVRKYQNIVNAFARSMTGNDAAARDLTQETFIRLYRHLDQFDAARPLRPYLLKITANLGRNRFKNNLDPIMATSNIDDLAEENVDSSREPTPYERLAREEKLSEIRGVVAALPPQLREVCSLFYLSDRSCAEVASILDISENAVKVALHRARKRLFNSLRNFGG